MCVERPTRFHLESQILWIRRHHVFALLALLFRPLRDGAVSARRISLTCRQNPLIHDHAAKILYIKSSPTNIVHHLDVSIEAEVAFLHAPSASIRQNIEVPMISPEKGILDPRKPGQFDFQPLSKSYRFFASTYFIRRS